MTSSPDREPAAGRLWPAIVLSSTEDECTVFAEGRCDVLAYARPFPAPRADRVTPGNLVAIAAAGGIGVVVWRWFDAVVLDRADGVIRLWEPVHGSVQAQPRDPQHAHRPGSRRYLSAGLPGAQWWVAGPAVDSAEEADVELDEVERFFTNHDLWDHLLA
jgi:hypothetical protein